MNVMEFINYFNKVRTENYVLNQKLNIFLVNYLIYFALILEKILSFQN